MKKVPVKRSSARNALEERLLSDLRALIIDARRKVAQTVNAELTLLYWHLGRRIRQHILKKKRADYGKEIVAALRRQLGWTHFKHHIPAETVRLLDMEGSGIRVASYWTEALPKTELERKLHEAVVLARRRLEENETRTHSIEDGKE